MADDRSTADDGSMADRRPIYDWSTTDLWLIDGGSMVIWRIDDDGGLWWFVCVFCREWTVFYFVIRKVGWIFCVLVVDKSTLVIRLGVLMLSIGSKWDQWTRLTPLFFTDFMFYRDLTSQLYTLFKKTCCKLKNKIK